MQVVTLTLNPALDVSTETGSLEPDRKLRCEAPRMEPGGGGINVARVVRELGGDALAVTTLGGPLGELVARLLNADGIPTEVIHIAGATRQSFTVHERSSDRQYRFVLPGPRLETDEWERCLQATVHAASNADSAVLSSSLPAGTPSDAFAVLGSRLAEAGVRVVVDTSGPALRAAINAPIELVKPSSNELAGIAGRDLRSEQDHERAARELLAAGRCGAIVVSLGPAGALAVPRDRDSVLVRAPAMRPVSAVGAGDSMVAAMALALGRGATLVEAVRDGVAAGTAAVITPGTELCRVADVRELVDRVAVTPLNRAGTGADRLDGRADDTADTASDTTSDTTTHDAADDAR